jgi:hypothetical protein
MKRFTSALLLARLLVVAQAPEAADSTRTIDVKLSRYASRLNASRSGSASATITASDAPFGRS